jgi:hypothetical protein
VRDGLTGRLNSELLALQQARESFPLWTSRGLPDGTIHSAGISMLTTLGQALGYEAYCEMPAPRKGRYAYVGDDVRSDSAWFDRNTGGPVLLAEFERYSGQIDESGLLIKVKNLLLAHHRAGETAECLVLAYWTKSLRDLPDHDALAHVFRRGFQTRAMEPVDGSSSGALLIYQFIVREADPGCWRLDQVKERGVR